MGEFNVTSKDLIKYLDTSSATKLVPYRPGDVIVFPSQNYEPCDDHGHDDADNGDKSNNDNDQYDLSLIETKSETRFFTQSNLNDLFRDLTKDSVELFNRD